MITDNGITDKDPLTVNAFPENIMHYVREAIEYIEKGETYSELGLDRVVKNPTQ
jgi:hypothetical protein